MELIQFTSIHKIIEKIQNFLWMKYLYCYCYKHHHHNNIFSRWKGQTNHEQLIKLTYILSFSCLLHFRLLVMIGHHKSIQTFKRTSLISFWFFFSLFLPILGIVIFNIIHICLILNYCSVARMFVFTQSQEFSYMISKAKILR